MPRLPLPAFEESEEEARLPGMASPLECLEVYGGNRRVNHAVQLPGLDGWVHSDPAGPARSGGDVHYISVCSRGTISRFALADVSGHGQSSDIVARLLRDLIHKYINTWDQSDLMRELNESLRSEPPGNSTPQRHSLPIAGQPGSLYLPTPGTRLHYGITPAVEPGIGSKSRRRSRVRSKACRWD